MSRIAKINERYDGNRVFKDRLDFMRNIEYVGEHRGFTMFTFTDIYTDYLQAACPELNIHTSDQVGIFKGDVKAMLDDLKSGMDNCIEGAKRISDGKIWSNVLQRQITV